MPTTATITFSVPFNDYSFGYNGQVMSTWDFRNDFLWGIPLCNPVTGQTLPNSVLLQKLLAAQRYVENMLDIKIFKQFIQETKHFVRDEYQSWGYVKASWWVNKPYYIIGTLNGQQVLQFPNEWVTVQNKLTKDYTFERNMYFVPNGQGTAVSFAYNFTINNLYAFYGSRIIPEYWQLQYLTGFEIIPQDVVNLIGIYTAIQLLPVIEMTIVSGGGYTFGSASNSLGLDGMSQSISKANGGNIFEKRIKQYQEQFDREAKQLRSAYTGFVFDVM
ncbi:MAG TPA: hypothetical protein VK890_08455 [Bacteroidia bacterium]|jgi:hypothetical protein|nr:hypothetical protein [Bacteroidia bacterium]